MRGLALALALAPAPAAAQSEPAPEPPDVGLDALLKLPDQTPGATQPARGGYTRKQWRDRFERARADLADARQRLASAQQQLGELASSSGAWQVAAPGMKAGPTENGPLSYSLREEIRRSREDITRAEQALDELRVEANLAGVPPEWTGPELPAPEPQADAVPTGSGS